MPLQTKIVKQRPVAPWFTEDIAVEKAKRSRLGRHWRLTKNSADLNCIWANADLFRTWSIQLRWDIIPLSLGTPSLIKRNFFELPTSCFTESPWNYTDHASKTLNLLIDLQTSLTNGKITTIRQQLAVIEVSDSALYTAIDTPRLNCELNTLLPTIVQELLEIMRCTLSKSCSLNPLPSELLCNDLDVLMTVICNIQAFNRPYMSHISYILKNFLFFPISCKNALYFLYFWHLSTKFALLQVRHSPVGSYFSEESPGIAIDDI